MTEFSKGSNRGLIIAILVAALIIGAGLAIGLAIGLQDDDDDCDTAALPVTAAPASSQQSSTGEYRFASVDADSEVCSNIGTEVLARHGGNAVDGAVAALLCTGVVSAHSAGLGGGAFYIYYDRANQTAYSIDCRETAPAASTEDMFVGDNYAKSIEGGMAAGIPGELKGMYELHHRFGKVPWRDLVMPTVRLCEDGVPLTEAVYEALELRVVGSAEREKTFEMYLDENGKIPPVGSKIKLPRLASTFRTIADDPMAFYTGALARDIVAELNEKGGIFALEDLANYTVKWSEPTVFQMRNNLTLYSTPPPGSGAVLSMILNILAGYKMDPSNIATDEATVLTTHRAIEAMKFSFGKRSQLGDDSFVDMTEHVYNMTSHAWGEYLRGLITDNGTHPLDYYAPSFDNTGDSGTTHLNVIDGMGNAVSVTSTINTYFGSKIKGNRTGIIYNNEMNDFSVYNTTNYFGVPASPANYVKPGKRPMSSMCPSVIVDRATGQVRVATGASGGSKITTAAALNVMDLLWFGQSAVESVDKKRYHHQLMPQQLQLEADFPETIKKGLEDLGHETTPMSGKSIVQVVDIDNGTISAVADYRKGGKPDGY